MNLRAIGCNVASAAVELRERLAFDDAKLRFALAELPGCVLARLSGSGDPIESATVWHAWRPVLHQLFRLEELPDDVAARAFETRAPVRSISEFGGVESAQVARPLPGLQLTACPPRYMLSRPFEGLPVLAGRRLVQALASLRHRT